uniref:Mantle gene 6 n=1 Tax=Pinctada fucata TaxID=50426 RepID=Q3YL60_PINFU|nr:mantle gene 6 [Pinctada fucata]
MRFLTIIATVLVLGVVVCDARKRWWRRATKKVELKPEIGRGGDWKVSGGISISWRKKRSIEKQGKFNIELTLDPCDLTSYDSNRDGVVTHEDMKHIFDNEELAEVFFSEADENDDEQISTSEFKDFKSRINQCIKD